MLSRLVPFELEHLDSFQHDKHAWVRGNIVGFTDYNRVEIYTMLCDDEAVAFLYINKLEIGVGLVWVTLGKNVARYKLKLHRLVKKAIHLLKEKGFLKLQALVDDDFQVGIDWIESLGFEREGHIKKYGLWGKDRYMYGRVLCQ